MISCDRMEKFYPLYSVCRRDIGIGEIDTQLKCLSDAGLSVTIYPTRRSRFINDEKIAVGLYHMISD